MDPEQAPWPWMWHDFSTNPDGVVPGDKTVPKPKQPISWRDTFDVWPHITLTLRPLPWSWRWSYYKDDLDPWWSIQVGPFALDFGWNRPGFPIERKTEVSD